MDAEQQQWVAEHMGLAQSLAMQRWRTASHALDLDDMRATAYHGLVQAAVRWREYCAEHDYDPAAMQYFKPFVVRRVNGALMDEIRRADWATRSLRTRAKQILEAGQDKGLSERELSERSGLSVPEIRATVRGMAQRPVSLEAEELELSSESDVESSALTKAVLLTVVDIVTALPREHAVVLALHYYKGLQLQEVARAMGITETRASQLHAKGVETVHAAMRIVAEDEAY